MPIYAFRCRECGLEFEELVPRMGEKAPCPRCGQKDVERLLSVPAAHRGAATASTPRCDAAPECGYS